MSQDLFDEEYDVDCPTEFTGISGSGTSSSPGSQPAAAPPQQVVQASPVSLVLSF